MEENKLESIIFGLKETIKEQKAEIERLKGFIDFKTANIMCDKCKEQAVKDTARAIAKELLCTVLNLTPYMDMPSVVFALDKCRLKVKELAERYGLEVE